MKIISHRGNLNGRFPEKENSLPYIREAILNGFDVEVDVWVINSQIYFGHDSPQYLITLEDLNKIKEKIWFHCKNLEALSFFSTKQHDPYINFFWHEKDDYTLTNRCQIWTYPGKLTTKNSIVVDLNLENKYKENEVFAICTDFPNGAGIE